MLWMGKIVQLQCPYADHLYTGFRPMQCAVFRFIIALTLVSKPEINFQMSNPYIQKKALLENGSTHNHI
jgi:hypothetical protein